MGLREKKAAQNRERMVRAALELFEQDGYDATTMEEIAERAEVGTTTLYRYFPSKDLLLLDHFLDALQLAPRLRDRPAEEPLEDALVEVMLDIARSVDDPDRDFLRVRRLIDSSSVPRARLWDFFLSARDDLAAAIAERHDAPAGELGARATAAMTLELVQIIDEASTRSSPPVSRTQTTRAVLSQLAGSELRLPALRASER